MAKKGASDKEREAVMLKLEGLTYKEIGKRMGCSETMAYKRVCNALGASKQKKQATKRGLYPNIEEYLADNMLTDGEFAEMCGMSAPTMSSILNGKRKPQKAYQEAIAKQMGVDVKTAFVIDMAGYK